MPLAAVAAYVLYLLYAASKLFRASATDAADYIVAGRRLTLPAFVATLVATWYGGILGVGEYAWRYGVSNWLVFGVPYYLAAAGFAFLLAGRAQHSRMLTIPDQLEHAYGRPAALVGAGVLFVMTSPAAYVLMLGVLLQLATGWPLWVGVGAGTALSVGYVYRAGLRAVVGTDAVQFCLMFLGFAVLVPACIARYGGWSALRDGLPVSHLTWDGGLGFQAVAVWYFLALVTLVEPTFYQRCYAARDPVTARRGVLVSIACWVLFDLLTTTAGLYARLALPDLTDPVAAFPALAAHTLTPFWQAVFLLGLLAAIMSTVDSYALLSAITLGRDILSRRGRGLGQASPMAAPQKDPELQLIRRSLLAMAAVSIALALWAGSVIALWKSVGSVATPVLLLPLVLSHTRWRPAPRRACASMVAAGSVSLLWLAIGRGGPWLGVEAIFPGLLVSAAMVLTGMRRARG